MHENWARPSATVSVGFETDRAAHLHSVPPDHHAPPTHVHRHLIPRVATAGEPHPHFSSSSSRSHLGLCSTASALPLHSTERRW
jgi:hypothetical protein